MIQNGPVSVLVAPLDWGLGHATRCIPVIRELIQQGAEVIIAAGPSGKAVLKSEFPALEIVDIPGGPIRYKRGFWLKWGIFFRIPALLKQIKKENEWLNELFKNRTIDAVISDNRYGLFHKTCFCVFITHQLQIQSGWGGKGRVGRKIDRQVLKWNYRFISKFSECWIPDLEGDFSAGGLLSHPTLQPPIPIRYVGILSRFLHSDNLPEKNSLLILISGPEPQRTDFENIIVSQLEHIKMKVIVVRGLPDSIQSLPFKKEGIELFNHLPSNELNELINKSEFIIARSGYSTIMDLLTVHKRAILVPTPGQTEQEYLGAYMNKRKWMYSVPQSGFNLQSAIAGYQKAELIKPDFPNSDLAVVVTGLLKRIDRKNPAVMVER